MKYSVIQEKTINGGIDAILNNITNFENWQAWSPWAVLDPDTIVNYETNSMYWDSKITGAGKMSLIENKNNTIKIDLEFIKPFKSKAKVEFTLETLTDKSTKVTWKMESTLPLFLVFLKKMFKVMIGRDFQRGLMRLKYQIEQSRVPAKVIFFDEPQDINGFQFTGFNAMCQFSNIAPSMKSSFTELRSIIQEANIPLNKMLCFSDKLKICKDALYYTVGIVHTGEAINTSKLKNKIIPKHKAIKVVLYGNYDFMGDAWTGIYCHQRGLKLKQNKKIAPYEICIKGPDHTDNVEEYITEVYMPVR